MAPIKSVLTRRTSRKKNIASTQARRFQESPSEPRLGAYGRKQSQSKLTPGHKRILRGKLAPPIRIKNETLRESGSYSKPDFVLFSIKHILTSGNLATRVGSRWKLKEDVAGISAGEAFTSLDACAKAMISSLYTQFEEQRAVKAAV